MAERVTTAQRFDRLETGMGEVHAELRQVTGRLDKMDLNGSTAKLKAVAAVSDDLIDMARQRDEFVALMGAAKELLAVAKERADDVAFWRSLKRRLRWENGTRTVAQIIFTALVGAAIMAYVTGVAAQWHWPGTVHP